MPQGTPASLQYDKRGWPCVEKALSAILKDSSRILDLGCLDSHHRALWRAETVRRTRGEVQAVAAPQDRHDLATRNYESIEYACESERMPPLLPAHMSCILDQRHFTNGSDREDVKALYNDAFSDMSCAAENLDFHNIGWKRPQILQLCESLRHFVACSNLVLSGNSFCEQSIAALMHNLPPNIEELNLSSTGISCGSLIIMAEALPNVPQLQRLDVSNNFVCSCAIDLVREAWKMSGKEGDIKCQGCSVSAEEAAWYLHAHRKSLVTHSHRDDVRVTLGRKAATRIQALYRGRSSRRRAARVRHVHRIKDAFRAADSSRSGSISEESLITLFRSLGNVSDTAIATITGSCITGEDRTLKYDDFIDWCFADEDLCLPDHCKHASI